MLVYLHVQAEGVTLATPTALATLRAAPGARKRSRMRRNQNGETRVRRRGARVAPRHVHAEAELIDVEQARRLDLLDLLPKGLTLLLDFGPIPFRSVLRFFSG